MFGRYWIVCLLVRVLIQLSRVSSFTNSEWKEQEDQVTISSSASMDSWISKTHNTEIQERKGIKQQNLPEKKISYFEFSQNTSAVELPQTTSATGLLQTTNTTSEKILFQNTLKAEPIETVSDEKLPLTTSDKGTLLQSTFNLMHLHTTSDSSTPQTTSDFTPLQTTSDVRLPQAASDFTPLQTSSDLRPPQTTSGVRLPQAASDFTPLQTSFDLRPPQTTSDVRLPQTLSDLKPLQTTSDLRPQTTLDIVSSSTEQDLTHTTDVFTDNTLNTTADATSFWQNTEFKKWFLYCSPVSIIVGTIGNFIAIITLQSRLFKSSSTSFILSALALCDIFVLNTGLMRWWLINLINVDVRDLSRFGCKIHNLCTYYSHQLASWTLVLLTFERTISITFPFKCKSLCSRRRIIIAWMTIAVVLFAANFHFFFSYDITGKVSEKNNITTVVYSCNPSSNSWISFLNGPWSWIDASLGDFIPFGVVVTGNIIIVITLVKSNRLRSDQMRVVTKNDGKVTSTTTMLIMVSIIFLICNVPSDLYFIGYDYGLFQDISAEEDAIANFFYVIVAMLYYANNAVEFILYFVSGSKFRTAFFDMFSCRKSESSSKASAKQSKDTTTMCEEAL